MVSQILIFIYHVSPHPHTLLLKHNNDQWPSNNSLIHFYKRYMLSSLWNWYVPSISKCIRLYKLFFIPPSSTKRVLIPVLWIVQIQDVSVFLSVSVIRSESWSVLHENQTWSGTFLNLCIPILFSTFNSTLTLPKQDETIFCSENFW